MQINMNTDAKRKSRRAKMLVIVVGAGLGVMALVRGTTAQPAANTPANNTASNNGNNLITDGLTDGKLTLSVNKTAVITTRAAIKRVVIGQPDVIRDNEIGPNTLLITALKPGSTQIIVWDDADRSQAVDVIVGFDLEALQNQYKSMFPESEIKVATLNGAIALTGHVPTLQVADQAQSMASPYGKILNFLEISGGQQVCLAVKFAEVSRGATSELGVNFGGTDGVSVFGNNIGQVSPLGLQALGSVGDVALSVANPSAAVTAFGKGVFGNTAFAYFVSALRENDLLRVLAEPNLVAISGQEANFLAGGEYPIPVSQGGATAGAITIEYREYGVRLKMTPVVLGNGKIRLKVAPEVSALDFTHAVVLSGASVPALTTRKMETVIELHEGQTFAIGGLLNNNVNATKNVTPILGDLPVLGALFRSVKYQRNETELVVLVTPYLVEGMNPDQVPSAPGEKWRNPNEVDLFLNQDIGGPANDLKSPTNHPTPLYHGPHGYSFDSTQPTTTTTQKMD